MLLPLHQMIVFGECARLEQQQQQQQRRPPHDKIRQTEEIVGAKKEAFFSTEKYVNYRNIIIFIAVINSVIS